jgi:LmbE family N-acetylglucosaminyl deacetylase
VLTSRLQVLLVEDDGVVASLITRLTAELADVHWYVSAEEALEVIATKNWDLVITDVGLPGISGIEFAGEARRRRPKAAVLIASARRRKAQGREAVLAIGAHPDDVEIGCGGILMRHASRGDAVAVLTLTGAGEQVGFGLNGGSLAAADLLGARLWHHDLAPAELGHGARSVPLIEEAIEEIGATTVYTHTLNDVDLEHRNVHRATMLAARQVPRIYCYQTSSASADFRPTRFASITEFIDGKLAAIRSYASGRDPQPSMDEDLLRATARYWSRFGHMRYAEALEIVRESDLAPEPHDVSSAQADGLPFAFAGVGGRLRAV